MMLSNQLLHLIANDNSETEKVLDYDIIFPPLKRLKESPVLLGNRS